MQKKALYDMDCALAPATRNVMKALIAADTVKAADFITFAMEHGASNEDEAATAEAELLSFGYIAFSGQYSDADTESRQIAVSAWPISRLYAHHDPVDDLSSYEMGAIHNLSDAVDYLTKTRLLFASRNIVSRKNLYVFIDSVISSLHNDEKIESIIVGVLFDENTDDETDSEDSRLRVASGNANWGALIHTNKRVFVYKDNETIERAEKLLFNAEVFDRETTHTVATGVGLNPEIHFETDDGAYMGLMIDIADEETQDYLLRHIENLA